MIGTRFPPGRIDDYKIFFRVVRRIDFAIIHVNVWLGTNGCAAEGFPEIVRNFRERLTVGGNVQNSFPRLQSKFGGDPITTVANGVAGPDILASKNEEQHD
jgi:hypothetical protein